MIVMFLKEVLCSLRLHFIKNTVKTVILCKILLQFNIFICIYFNMQFIYLMPQLNFQQPSFQSLASHDPSEIILICLFCDQETFLLLVLKSVVLRIFK